MNNKKVLLAPLMGATISLFIFTIYLLSTINYQTTSVLNLAFSLLKVLPLFFFIFIVISYVVSAVVGIPLVYIKNKFFLSPKLFWLLTFTVSFILGVIAGVMNYQIESITGKAIAIYLSFTFGGLFSASLYSVLNGEVESK